VLFSARLSLNEEEKLTGAGAAKGAKGKAKPAASTKAKRGAKAKDGAAQLGLLGAEGGPKEKDDE
jgi:hypothetical protein